MEIKTKPSVFSQQGLSLLATEAGKQCDTLPGFVIQPENFLVVEENLKK